MDKRIRFASLLGKNKNLLGARKVLIYRLGSLGDTVIALPLFHLIQRVFPSAGIAVLSANVTDSKAISVKSLLDGSGLVHQYINYQVRLRNLKDIYGLRQRIRDYNPDVLIYLTEPRGRFSIYRDTAFFYFCGIKCIIGAPLSADKLNNSFDEANGLYENETERLARCLSVLGDAHLELMENWSLRLSKEEEHKADNLLKQNRAVSKFIVFGLGTKIKSKDWGQSNWQNLIAKLSEKFYDYAVVFIGAKDEYDYCDSVGRFWKNDKINLCGLTKPREAAAIIKKAAVYIGHDSGSMHLAAAQGIPIVAIFSSRAKPGIWFPYWSRQNILFNSIKCQGCLLDNCPKDNKCIKMTTVDKVYLKIEKVLKSTSS
ncbi:glycosyltransferase family 9 protein [candidate division TA06 bacterium]|uniref:Glycosyltransferase family 9 protein n=1 Tax=candidate division TA06 bacterium TaxID=2250710 RepID=A0A933IA89_UNCT6|nr:glycosyltransferase family 9 protein [candidate division TA06 bacterium]